MTVIDAVRSYGPVVYDIRRNKEPLDLKKQILDGLSSSDPELPSLLLWDDEGLRLFDAFSKTPDYYLRSKEMEILEHHVEDMAERIPSGSALIELGCGTLQKTGALLSALEHQGKNVSYYALDVSPEELAAGLSILFETFGSSKHLDIRGLLGTYEDCVAWLASQSGIKRATAVNFLWMGNSIANFDFFGASSLLSRFVDSCFASKMPCQFLVSIDACPREDKILQAYNPDNRSLSEFILNGLRHANSVLGQEIFQVDEWKCVTKFDHRDRILKVYYSPCRDIDSDIDGKRFAVNAEQGILAITSGKWVETDVHAMSAKAGLRVVDVWKDTDQAYCFYALAPHAARIQCRV